MHVTVFHKKVFCTCLDAANTQGRAYFNYVLSKTKHCFYYWRISAFAIVAQS